MKRASIGERYRYAFDAFMARGTVALIAGLFAVSAVLILAVALLVTVTDLVRGANDSPRLDFLDALWLSLLRTLDPGTMGSDHGQPGFVLAMFVVTLGGIFIVATLIGIVSTGLEGRLVELRKGHSRVIEEGHTVIVGWSQAIFTVIAQLVIANAGHRRATIVVLADRDKVAMEDEIKTRVKERGSTRIVCRSGSPIDIDEVAIAGITTARAVVVLSPPVDDPDTDVIKTLLAINNSRHRPHGRPHVVAELRDARSLDVARMAGGSDVQLVVAAELVARITAQACRQPGLSEVYLRLLDFAGDDIYVTHQPALSGRTFGDALLAFEDSALLGLVPADGPARLVPPMSTVIGPDDMVITISRDRSAVRIGDVGPVVDEAAIGTGPLPRPGPERTLVLGWSPLAELVIRELDRYVERGSAITVVAAEPAARDGVDRLAASATRATIALIEGDTTSRLLLDRLDVPSWDHVILLGAAADVDPQRADARTLVSLLHLRDIAARSDRRFSIVSEMHDVRNRDLAEVAQADDFIVSDRLVSLFLAQVAQERRLDEVFGDLFEPTGSEIYLEPALCYVAEGVPVTYATVVAAARQRGQVAIGYRDGATAGDPGAGYGIRLNPPKSSQVMFGPADRVIVVALA